MRIRFEENLVKLISTTNSNIDQREGLMKLKQILKEIKIENAEKIERR